MPTRKTPTNNGKPTEPKLREKNVFDEPPREFCRARNCTRPIVAHLIDDEHDYGLCSLHMTLIVEKIIAQPWVPLKEALSQEAHRGD